MYIAFKVDGHVIEGNLTGSYKTWKFVSHSPYFLEAFPYPITDAEYFRELYDANNIDRDPKQESIYGVLFKEARYFLETVPEAFDDNSYKRLCDISETMSVTNVDKSIFYVCAPVEKHALNNYKTNHLPDNANHYKPRYKEELTIYEVSVVEVFNTHEVDYEFKRVYDKSIKIDLR